MAPEGALGVVDEGDAVGIGLGLVQDDGGAKVALVVIGVALELDGTGVINTVIYQNM